MKTKQNLRIVLSSPTDVKEEREIMEDVIQELTRGIADDRNLRIELSRWETDAYPGFHAKGPQGLKLIRGQIFKIDRTFYYKLFCQNQRSDP